MELKYPKKIELLLPKPFPKLKDLERTDGGYVSFIFNDYILIHELKIL